MRKHLRTILGVAISVAAVAALFRAVPLRALGDAISSANAGYILAGLAALACGYTLRALRWWLMLRSGNPAVKFGSALRVLLVGFAANNVLPLRAGDALRGFGFGEELRAPTALVVASLAVERLLDLLSLLVLGCCVIRFGGLAAVPQRMAALLQWMTLAGALALGAALLFSRAAEQLALRLLQRLVREGSRRESLRNAVSGACGFLHGLGGARTANLFVLSIAAWLCELALYLSVARALDARFAFAWCCLVLVGANLTTIVPSSPGYIGTFHASVVALLLLAGISRGDAMAYAVLVHGALWCGVTLAGAVAYLSLRAVRRAASPSPVGELG
ncbi:MAG TPA: lysylphosphatidylglycerol synthase transmembrane domain-containing protein [Terriglobales bacterium]|nr:lysylphosphatidylglycerol synthase transmembrane domain-containing protein [Terriglobales bacterium]